MAFVSDKSDHNDRDRIILGIAIGLGDQMGLNYHPNKVSWKDAISTGRSRDLVPSDGCEVVGELTLPARMRTKLNPEDWRPIIASSMIYNYKLSSRRAKHFLSRWILGGILPLSALIIVLVFQYSPRVIPPIPLLMFVITVFTGLITYLITAPYSKKMRLLADQITTQTVDRESFILVLVKIHALGMDDINKLEQRRGLRAWFMRRPSISERIQNLKALHLS